MAGHSCRGLASDLSFSGVVAGGTDGVVQYWSTQTGAALGRCASRAGPQSVCAFVDGPDDTDRFVAHAAPLTSLALSPDGTRLFTGADHGELRQWAGRLGRRLLTVRPEPRVAGDTVRCRGVALAPNGTAIAVALGDGRLFVYRTADGQVCRGLAVGHSCTPRLGS
jgi:WD40 repeat protein